MNLPELKSQLQLANHAYARGNPIMPDHEYDLLWRQLQDIDPTNPILYHTAQYSIHETSIFRHAFPLRGTQKAFNQEDLKPFLARFGSEILLLEPKYDGCAAVMYAQVDGLRLVKEGNGLEGADISRHIPWIAHKQNCHNHRAISGEVVIPTSWWKTSWGKNPRNTVAGWLNSGIAPGYAQAQFVPHNPSPLSHEYCYKGNLEELTELLLKLHTQWKQKYPIDGVMIKVKDPKRRLIAGDNGIWYNWSIAWKPPIQTAKTIVTEIEWNVSRSGRIIPTVIYEPVELCGTINTRVTGNNWQWLVADKDIAVGDSITIGKAGEIIPKIIAVKKKTNYNEHPNTIYNCPICKSALSFIGKDAICKSDNCISQLAKSLAYFYSDKGMELKSVGEKRIFELLQNISIRNILKQKPWCLLINPTDFPILHSFIKSIWNDARYNIYTKELKKLHGTKNPAHFIAALGMPGLAYKSAVKLFHYMKGQPLRANISKKAATSFVTALPKFIAAEKELPRSFFASLPDPAKHTFCITGTLSAARNDIITELSNRRWEFTNQVSKHTDFLVVGEGGDDTTKFRKATELGIPKISEEQMYKIIGDQDERQKTNS